MAGEWLPEVDRVAERDEDVESGHPDRNPDLAASKRLEDEERPGEVQCAAEDAFGGIVHVEGQRVLHSAEGDVHDTRGGRGGGGLRPDLADAGR